MLFLIHWSNMKAFLFGIVTCLFLQHFDISIATAKPSGEGTYTICLGTP